MKETLNLKGSKATGPSLLNLRHIHIIDNVKGGQPDLKRLEHEGAKHQE